jgi:hypothetical protein
MGREFRSATVRYIGATGKWTSSKLYTKEEIQILISFLLDHSDYFEISVDHEAIPTHEFNI